jgi:hypothetical protein
MLLLLVVVVVLLAVVARIKSRTRQRVVVVAAFGRPYRSFLALICKRPLLGENLFSLGLIPTKMHYLNFTRVNFGLAICNSEQELLRPLYLSCLFLWVSPIC